MRTVCAANGSTRNSDRQVRLPYLFMVLTLGQLCPRLARVIRRVKLRNLVDDGLSCIRKGNTKKTSFGDSGLESEGRIERGSGRPPLTRVGATCRRRNL